MADEIQGSFSGRSFFSKQVALDGSSFRDCVFTKCRLTYSGGEIPQLSGCRFDECGWEFGGQAANTIAFLSGMYRGGFDRLIESTFHEIRKGAMISQEPLPGPTKSADSPGGLFLKPLRVFRIPKTEQ